MSDYVCEELIDEILTRLPSKSLLRFRCLSKLWCSRIASPDFIHNHALRSPKKVLIKHQKDPNRIGMEKLYTLHSEDQLPLNGYMGITPLNFPCNYCFTIGSCNGLVCLFDQQIGAITLWNPSIRRKLTVPHPPLRYSPPLVFGFGFDPITCDYKIVGISWPLERVAQESLVYTMSTGTWRFVASPSTTQFSYLRSRCACFVNGALHWIVTDLHNGPNCHIVSFDLSTEVFGKMLLPEPCWEARDLMIIKGSLAVGIGDYHNPTIWVRRKVNDIESWSVLFKLKALPCEGGLRRAILLTTNGDLVVLTANEGYKVYNPVTGVRSGLVNFKPKWYKLEVETYTESLALLNKGTSCNGDQPSRLPPRKRKRKKKTSGI